VSASPDRVSRSSIVELRTAASPAMIPTIRAVAADLAGRADFDLDAISDLRMAVDETCATLVSIAAPEATLTCRFTVVPDVIEVEATDGVAAGQTTEVVATDTFGWRVLQTLADNVRVLELPGAAPQVGIRLVKRALTDQR
jgi:serine/threonine-protein kinase RsbW